MIYISFTNLELILLLWFAVYSSVLIACKLTGDDDIELTSALILFILLPVVIALFVLYGIYTITIGLIVDLVRAEKRFRRNHYDTEKLLTEKIDEINKLKQKYERPCEDPSDCVAQE